MLFRLVNEDPVRQFARLNLIFKIECIKVMILRKEKKKGGGNTINPFPNDKLFTLPDSKHWQTTISSLMKMAENSPNR